MIYSKDHSRYPYTFAYDWIRSAGLADSRANAANWFRNRYSDDGMRLFYIEQAAQEYMDYWNAYEELQEKARRKMEAWRN